MEERNLEMTRGKERGKTARNSRRPLMIRNAGDYFLEEEEEVGEKRGYRERTMWKFCWVGYTSAAVRQALICQ